MKMIKTLPVYDSSGNEVDKFALDEALFDGAVDEALLHQVIVGFLANRRSGTASTKTRGEVSGGGKKPWKQKGTGRARAGSIRSPLWRHGGVVFGPHPRDFSHNLTKGMKRNALLSSLNAKIRDNEVKVINEITLGSPKTKPLCAILEKLGIADSALLVAPAADRNLKLSSRNIAWILLMRSSDLNAYDLLRYKNILLTRRALEDITVALKKG